MGDEYVIVGQKDDGESFIGLMNQLLAKMSDFPKNMMEIIHQIFEIHNKILQEKIDKLGRSFDKSEEAFEDAFYDLKDILRDEAELIINKFI